jgi:hypothetical protein
MKIGITELLILTVIPLLILFFVFKAGQWRGEAKNKRDKNKGN